MIQPRSPAHSSIGRLTIKIAVFLRIITVARGAGERKKKKKKKLESLAPGSARWKPSKTAEKKAVLSFDLLSISPESYSG